MQVLLTPVAIAAGRRLAERLFNGQADLQLDYANIPSVVFSHPPVGALNDPTDQMRKDGLSSLLNVTKCIKSFKEFPPGNGF